MANRNNTLYSDSYIKRNIHIAYIIQGGKIISIASNTLRSMTGLDYNHKYTTDSACHAEMACIKNIKMCNREKTFKKKLVLYSLAFKVITDNNGNIIEYKLQSGKPCRSCAYNLIRYNIKKIWFSNHNSEIEELCLDNKVAESSVISSGSVIKLNFNRIYNNFPYKLFDMLQDSRCNTLILPRKDAIFKIGTGNIVLFQYYNKKIKKMCNIKVNITDIEINNTYHQFIRNIMTNNIISFANTYRQFVNMYKHMLKKTKTYIMIHFTKIN